MPTGNFSVDGSTDLFTVREMGDFHFTVEGNFGSGTITLEKSILGTIYPLRKSDDSAIIHTAPFDRSLSLVLLDRVRITLTGSTGANIDWSIGGLFYSERAFLLL